MTNRVALCVTKIDNFIHASDNYFSHFNRKLVLYDDFFSVNTPSITCLFKSTRKLCSQIKTFQQKSFS